MTNDGDSPQRHLQLYRWRDRKSRLFDVSAKLRLRLRLQSIVLELHGRHGRGRLGSDASVGSPRFDAGWQPTSAAAYMNNLVQNENSQFGSFQAAVTQLAQEDPEYLGDMAAWAQSTTVPISS